MSEITTIVRGADMANLRIELTDDNGDAIALPGNIEMMLVTVLGEEKAKYKKPETEGFHLLRTPEDGVIEFDIHREDSENFSMGDLFARVSLNYDDNENFPDGYKPTFGRIRIGLVMP